MKEGLGRTLPEAAHWLAMSKLYEVTTWLPKHGEIPNAAAEIDWAFNEVSALASSIGN